MGAELDFHMSEHVISIQRLVVNGSTVDSLKPKMFKKAWLSWQ